MEPPGLQKTKETFAKWNTEYLISIWLSNDRDEYGDEAFDALKQILLEREVSLSHPGEPVKYRKKQFDPPAKTPPPSPYSELNPSSNPGDETLVTIGTCSDITEADLIKSRLEAEGISVFLLGGCHVHFIWLHSQAIGGIRVQVKRSDAKQALELIGLLKEAALEIEGETGTVCCPNCGSEDISRKRTMWKIAFLSYFLCQIPLPFARNTVICNSCGHKWKTLEKIKEKPRKEDGKDQEEWECSECGAVVAVDAMVCPKCGADVSEIEED